MINVMILILILLIFRSLMAMSLNVPLMVYILSQALPELLRMCSTDFNNRNNLLTAKLLNLLNLSVS